MWNQLDHDRKCLHLQSCSRDHITSFPPALLKGVCGVGTLGKGEGGKEPTKEVLDVFGSHMHAIIRTGLHSQQL